MNDLSELKNDFNLVATAVRFPELSDDQWAILVEGESAAGLEALGRLTRAAREGNPQAVDTLKAWHKAVRVTAQLRAHGFPQVTKRRARKLMELYDTDRVVTAIHAIGQGSAGMRAQVARWLDDVRAQMGDAPVTSCPPAAASPGVRPRFAAVPPPPGVHTGRVRPVAPSPALVSTTHSAEPRQHLAPAAAPSAGGPTSRRVGNAPTSPGAPPTATDPRHFDQHICYGRDTAVAFDRMPNPDRTADTIMFKVAQAKGAGCLSGLYWDDAIRINLAADEVLTVAGVLLGSLDRVHYGGHGRDHRKWFELVAGEGRWAGTLRLTAADGETRRTVSIGAKDVGKVIALFYRALASQLNVDPGLYPSIIERAVEFYRHQDTRQQEKRAGGVGAQAH